MAEQVVQNCPVEFEYGPAGTDCILACPSDRGFETTVKGAGYSCTYTKDPTITFGLKSTPRYQSTQAPVSYKNLPNAVIYETAVNDYNTNLAIAQGKIDREEQVTGAFQNLQDAENVRDQSPDAYEMARIAYYRLTKGESWLDQERQRIANTEAQPVIDDYLNTYTDLVQRTQQQQQTIDAVDGIKDNLISVTDDMRFSVGAFEKQINEIKNQVQITKRNKVQEVNVFAYWFDLILNILIAIGVAIVIFFVWRGVARRASRATRVSTPVPIPQPTR
jgi:hypothetical protein